MATRWLALRLLMSWELIYGTGCGKFKWKENGKSPIVLVFGPGNRIGVVEL